MAGNKKHGGDQLVVRKMPNASERARNRASPFPVVRLYDHLSSDQKKSIEDMDLGSMLDIKCHVLHNPLIRWLAPLYDSHSREFVIPGRGRIPLNADSIYRTLGLPRGDIPVVYAMDSGIEARLGPLLFPGHSSTPKITGVFTMLSEMTQDDDIFKQVWMMYLVCTLLAPTTSNKVSNRCYPILENISNVRNMNLCQFVCDRLHDELCTGKPSGGCLFHVQLLYVDSLDISSLNLDLPDVEQTNVVAEVPVVEQTRVTRSAAKAACAANVPCQVDKVPVVNFSDNMSDVESYHFGNDSDYVDESVTARFVIQSRRPVDASEHADIVLSECAAVPSQTTLSGVATVVPGVSPELVSSGVPMHIDGAVAEPSDADAVVRVMETDITVPPPDNRIVFQGLENFAETVAMHIDGVVDEPDSANGNKFVSKKNDDDLIGAKDASVDAAFSSVGVKSGEVLSSSPAVAVTNEDNGKGFSDGYDAVSETINDVVNELKRSSSAFDASEAKRSCVVGEDRSVNPEQNVPSCPPKKKPNVRARRPAVSKSRVATRSSPRRPPRGKESVHEDPLEASFAPPDFGTSVTNQTADTIGDVAHHASAVIGTTVDVARDAEQNATIFPQGKIVTIVKRARLVAADGKLSLTPGIPIDIPTDAVSIRNTIAAEKSASPAEALGNSDGHDSTISVDVVKESETANVSSIPPTAMFFVDEDGGATDLQEYCYDESVDGVHHVIATEISNNEADDLEVLYITPALPVPVQNLSVASRTPRTKLRMERVVLPSKFILPPYNRVTSTDEQDILYQQVIKHNSESEHSKIKESRFLMIDPMWVSTGDLASSVMPSGELSATVAEIGIAVLQVDCPKKKIIFPWIVTVYLLERRFDSKILKKHFRMDEKYKLSHQNLNLGTVKKPCGHWYSLFLNFEKKDLKFLILRVVLMTNRSLLILVI
ncbi:hypothetical protein ACQ4PT_041929 [Festuca glaucescens]